MKFICILYAIFLVQGTLLETDETNIFTGSSLSDDLLNEISESLELSIETLRSYLRETLDGNEMTSLFKDCRHLHEDILAIFEEDDLPHKYTNLKTLVDRFAVLLAGTDNLSALDTLNSLEEELKFQRMRLQLVRRFF